VLALLNETIVHLVYGEYNPFMVDGGICVQHGIKCSQNLQIPKLDLNIKTSGLIQKCSNNLTTKMMVIKRYHAKLSYNG